MILLTSAADIIKVNVSIAATVHVHASWVDNVTGTITPGRTNTTPISGTGDTTVVAGPASGQRNVKGLSIRNAHASTATVVSVLHSDGTTIETLMTVTLLAGESLVLDALGRWWHYGVNARYGFTGGPATQAQMETGSSIVLMVTPANQNWHPSTPKCWVKCGVTGNVLASYNITSVTDTGTGLATVNIGTDFSSANWCCQVQIERTSTSMTMGTLQQHCAIRSAGQAAGTLLMEAWDETAATALQADPTAWHMVGLGDQ